MEQWIGREGIEGKGFVGRWIPLASEQAIIEPATGQTLGRIGLASPSDIRAAAERARSVQRSWADMAYEDRAQILRDAAAILTREADAIGRWLVRESGSTFEKAGFEIAVSAKVLYEAAAMASQPRGHVLPSSSGRLSIARRMPIGVVGVIAPFNFPLYLAMRAIAPALAVGNAVILKPDPRTAVCGGVTIARVLQEAGLPEGVFSMLPGGGDAGAELCRDPNVGMIQFTGSTPAGRKVGALAGEHLKKVSLELGGKNSLIILDDADLDRAVGCTSWGSYLHQGQICMAAGRVLVHQSLSERFLERLAAHAAALPVGDPTGGAVALGPLISEGQLNHARTILAESTQQGARLLTGGPLEGLFFKPAVLTDVGRDNVAFEQEIFAPVAVITPFHDDEEAIALANATDFGLAAGILTNHIGRALAIAAKLRVGLLHINDQTVNDDCVNPFGGVGNSGNGTAIGGPANWDEFTTWQWLTIRGEPPAYPL